MANAHTRHTHRRPSLTPGTESSECGSTVAAPETSIGHSGSALSGESDRLPCTTASEQFATGLHFERSASCIRASFCHRLCPCVVHTMSTSMNMSMCPCPCPYPCCHVVVHMSSVLHSASAVPIRAWTKAMHCSRATALSIASFASARTKHPAPCQAGKHHPSMELH